MSNFLGSRSPGSRNTYISTWLSTQANDPLACPSGVVKAVFDNNQKIGKTILITGENTVLTSVMTSNIWINFSDNSAFQKQKHLSPTSWMWNDRKAKSKELVMHLTEPGNNFRKARDAFLNACINEVYNEHKGGKDYTHAKLESDKHASTEKMCTSCGCENDVSYRICRNCQGKLIRPSSNEFVPPELHVDPPPVTNAH